eukprot:scaffold107071_cov37-Tisochrysis_lutea.AAC.2
MVQNSKEFSDRATDLQIVSVFDGATPALSCTAKARQNSTAGAAHDNNPQEVLTACTSLRDLDKTIHGTTAYCERTQSAQLTLHPTLA